MTSVIDPAATLDPRHYIAEEILHDGGSILLRAIRPDDKEKLVAHFSGLGPRSVYLRFFGPHKRLTEAELKALTEIDFVDHVALVATLRVDDSEQFIGVGRYIRSPPGSTRAEVAFAVLDSHQGRGIGTLLLEHLSGLARSAGIDEFEADVLSENIQMLNVFGHSGFANRRSVDEGVVHVVFPTAETERFREASARRDRIATARSLRAILQPQSVALIGASRHAGTIGHTLWKNLRAADFRGEIYPVNPGAASIEGLPCFPTVAAIGRPIDLAIVAVPAAKVEASIHDCAVAGVRGLVVISSGFAEVSAEGRENEWRIRQSVRHAGMRMVGPNCMGVLNTAPNVRLNGTFAPTFPPAGNIGMLSQSGALGIAILDRVRDLNLGISTFVSVGNKADVSGNDLLAYWAEDPETSVIVLYLESFGNPRTFARLAPEVARQKPIVVVKSGRSAAGTRAASSHSAALANLDVAVDALFEQAGVIRTNTLEELFDTAALLATQPVPTGPRVGVVTNAGGPGILLADACDAHGLVLPTLAPETLATLRSFLPSQAGLANPIDMVASASPEQFARTIEAVGNDPNVDSLVVIYIPLLSSTPEEVAAAIARGAAMVPRHKPLSTVFLSSQGVPALLCNGPRGRIPSHSYPENAARALAAAVHYGRWRSRPRGKVLELDRTAKQAIRALVEERLAKASEPVWLEPDELATILRHAGISWAASRSIPASEAVAAGEEMGYPLVAKAIAPGLLHKSDAGAVILGLTTPDDVEEAVEYLRSRMDEIGKPLEGVLLQREVRGGIEALVGVTTDPTFGPLLVCGMGGVLVELLQDVSFHLAPVSDLDAEEMLGKLRAARLLDGYRGSPAGDRAALADLIQRVSALVEIVPEIRELDLNPIKLLEPGRGAIVVDGRLRLAALGSRASAMPPTSERRAPDKVNPS